MGETLFSIASVLPIRTEDRIAWFNNAKAAVSASKVPFKKWEEGFTLHHTAIPALKDGNVRRAAAIEKYHRLSRGWKSGLGYHFLIEYDGTIAIGLRWRDQLCGAHAKGYNCSTIGISLVGNFDEETPTKAQLESLVLLVAELNKRIWKIKAVGDLFRMTHYHCDSAPKTCPGKKWMPLREVLTASVMQRSPGLLISKFYEESPRSSDG